MQNLISVPSAARINFQGLGELLAANIPCFVIKTFFVASLRCFSAILGVRLYFIWIYGERWMKRGKMLDNMKYQRGNGQ